MTLYRRVIEKKLFIYTTYVGTILYIRMYIHERINKYINAYMYVHISMHTFIYRNIFIHTHT